ncbi:MAG: hypothetical protein J6U27_04005 [Spirochaetales bacterium]|nr:hypothetical protein [Spirochaetales bacterium]
MADKNVPSADNNSKLKVVESKQKTAKKEPMTFKKLITIIIIVVLAMLMVGGIYYVVVMVAQSRAEKASAWGTYDGENIVIENNNVFYNTLVNDSNLQTAYLNGDYNSMLSSYYNAYQAQVVFTALSKEAKKAGIVAPQDLVNELILRAGVYNGSDGTFSQEVFDASSEAERVQVNNYYTAYYPYNKVLSDLQTTIVSQQESDFVSEIAQKTSSFDYFVINYNAYPDDLAVAYATENEGLFDRMGLSILSATTTDKINEAYEALNSGTQWADAVFTYSEDSYASGGGSVGTIAVFSLLTNLNDEADIEKIKALEVGTYSEPIPSPMGYTIYRLDTAFEAADYSDAETLSSVKYYINQNNHEEVAPYIETAVGLATAQAQTDFAAAADSVNAEVVSVNGVSNNIGGSQYLGGFESYDSLGYLASAAKDEAVSKELFAADEGYVTGAIPVPEADDSSYIVAKVTAKNTEDENNAYVTSMLYSYYAPLQPVYDTAYNVMNSSKHQENFYTQFFSTLFSSNT